MTRAYLSGPILHNQMRKDDFYRTVVEQLESAGIDVFAPQFMQRATPREIYLRDTKEVRLSDFLIAEVSNPSHGVGMEIMLAIELKKPILLFRQLDAPPLSYMVRGADCTVLFDYSTLEDVQQLLGKIDFEALIVHTCSHCASHVAELSSNGLKCVKCGAANSPE